MSRRTKLQWGRIHSRHILHVLYVRPLLGGRSPSRLRRGYIFALESASSSVCLGGIGAVSFRGAGGSFSSDGHTVGVSLRAGF